MFVCVFVCLSVCLSVNNLAWKLYWSDKEEMFKFWKSSHLYPDLGIFRRILQHCEIVHVFNKLARISGKTDLIFMAILSECFFGQWSPIKFAPWSALIISYYHRRRQEECRRCRCTPGAMEKNFLGIFVGEWGKNRKMGLNLVRCTPTDENKGSWWQYMTYMTMF